MLRGYPRSCGGTRSTGHIPTVLAKITLWYRREKRKVLTRLLGISVRVKRALGVLYNANEVRGLGFRSWIVQRGTFSEDLAFETRSQAVKSSGV